MAAVRGADGQLAGAVGLQKCLSPLTISFRTHQLVRLPGRAIKVLGGEPLLADDANLHLEFVRFVFSAFPDCDYLSMPVVPLGSPAWRLVAESAELRRLARVYLPGEAVPHPQISVPPSFAQYLKQVKTKNRHNWQRQMRRLAEHGGGQIELLRVECAADVRTFLDAAVAVSLNSWQHRALGPQMDNTEHERRRFVEFADGGVLRSYLLRCGGTPCAFLRGFQYGNVFYFSRTGFDERFSPFSPGMVLFYMVIEDLCTYRPPARGNLQEGYWGYKAQCATDVLQKTSVILLRRGARLRSCLSVDAHRGYRRLVRWVKRRLHYRSSLGHTPNQADQ
jgi:hypothetical protein